LVTLIVLAVALPTTVPVASTPMAPSKLGSIVPLFMSVSPLPASVRAEQRLRPPEAVLAAPAGRACLNQRVMQLHKVSLRVIFVTDSRYAACFGATSGRADYIQ
jgi:hypothetical protein